jgi:hypothetical protein
MFTVNANKYHVNTILIIFQAYLFTIVAPLPEHFQIHPSRIPGPQSLGKKEICREGWDLGFIYPNETSPSLGEKVSFILMRPHLPWERKLHLS